MGLKDVGVPVLNLEVDCVDERNFAAGQVRTRIEAFMEMLLNQRAAAGASRAARVIADALPRCGRWQPVVRCRARR